MPRYHTGRVALAMAVLVWGAAAAYAVVDTIDATVTAEVQEFVGGSAGNSDSAFEDLEQTTGNLPLVAEAELFRTTGGQDEAGATATTSFFDPRASLTPDPDEFGIDIGTFSLLPDISYAVLSNSTETREITFLADEIREPDGTELSVRSQFFLDGVLLVWGERDNEDLSGTTAGVVLSVLQTRPGDGEPTAVLNASLTLTGRGDGTATLSTSGSLAPENVTVLDLTDPTDDFGPMHLVIIPASTALPYVYPAEVGQTFVLKAEIEGQAHSQPGTGASVELGVPLLELAELVNTVAGGGTGDLLQEIIEAALGSPPIAAKPLLPAAENTTVTVVRRSARGLEDILALPFCGSMGVESAVLLTLFAAGIALSSRHG